jgi:hypothetical protein
VGVGVFTNFAVTDRFIQGAVAAQPEPAAQARYAEPAPLFAAAYRSLEPIFGQLC